MESAALKFFKNILETPSPSGYESPVQQIVRDYVADFADDVKTDLHGNVIVAKNPDAKFRVMLAGHCDQIGLIVSHIDDEGFLYVQPIGGWDVEVLIGQRMTVWTADRPDPRRDRPKADPPAHRGRTQASAEDEGPLARHRRGRQGRGRASWSASATPSRCSLATTKC